MKAYLKRSKNDANDAAAIRAAVMRPSMRFVPTQEQQSALILHRARQLLVHQRTMLSNALRGHLAALGIVSAKGRNGTAELATYFAPEGSGLTARQVAGQLGSLGHEVEILSSSKICLTRFTRHVRAVHDAAGAVGPYAVTPEAWDKILAAPNFQA